MVRRDLENIIILSAVIVKKYKLSKGIFIEISQKKLKKGEILIK
ncbi:MAG: hypothetical protein E6729_03155 [Finegoldia magna]|nr:hypothetical protein [Finegoldia magna]